MKKYTKEVKVGITALMTLVIFYFGFRYLKGVEIFAFEKTYYLYYPKAPSLEIASPVSLNGMAVGKVQEMQHIPERNYAIEVKISIKNDLPLTKGTIGELQDDGILGGKKIALILPNTGPLHRNGDTLIARTKATIMDLVSDARIHNEIIASINNLSKTLANINTISSNMTHTMGQFDSLSTSLNHLLSDNKQQIGQSIGNLTQASTTLNSTLSQAENLLKDLRTGIKTIDPTQINTLIQQVKGTFSSLNLILDTLNQGQSTISKLFKDDTLHKELTSTLSQLTNLLTQLQTHPKDFLAPFGRSDKRILRRKARKKQK